MLMDVYLYPDDMKASGYLNIDWVCRFCDYRDVTDLVGKGQIDSLVRRKRGSKCVRIVQLHCCIFRC